MGKYLPHLDGVRALGVIWVIYYHMGFTFARHAWLCISQFFAASGILITAITIGVFEKHGQVEIIRFWARRVGRLFPALLLLISVIAVVSYFSNLDPEDQFYVRGDLIAGLFYFENMHLIHKQEDYFAGMQKPSILRHIWTLAIEEQYYAVWPILFWLWTTCFMRRRTVTSDAPDFQGLLKEQAEDEGHELREKGSLGVSHAHSVNHHVVRAGILSSFEQEQNIQQRARRRASTGESDLQSTQHREPADEDVEQAMPDLETADLISDSHLENCEEHSTVKPARSQLSDGRFEDPSFRRCLYALCFGELLVIWLSYLSSFPTISELGMSAAYFSTWSRCGDFACGGLVYILVHLHSPTRRRYEHEEGLAPMSFQYRVILEVLSLCLILSIVLPPMIPLPLDDMLHFYFDYFRIPFSFVTILLTVPVALQDSERPLPRWAIFTRFLTNHALCVVGMVSYSVYLVHWPLILWFGEPMNHSAFESKLQGTFKGEEYGTAQLLRDHAIAIASITISLASFFLYEKPLVVLAAKTKKPWKVIVCGLIASVFIGMLILICTPAAKDPNNQSDWDTILDGGALERGTSLPEAWRPTIGANTQGIEDGRYTPIGFLTPTYSGMSIASILDEHMLPQGTYLNYALYNDYGDGWPAATASAIFEKLSQRAGPNSVIFSCRTILGMSNPEEPDHPCWNHDWATDMTWVWVKSNLLCSEVGQSNELLEEDRHDAIIQSTTCQDKIDIMHVDLPYMQKWEVMDNRWGNGRTYSGRQDRDSYLLQQMILAAAEQNPGAFNQASIASMREDHEKGSVWMQQMEQFVDADGKFELPEEDGNLKILIMGESVAYKIGVIAKELVQSLLPCESKMKQEGMEIGPFPSIDIINLGAGGKDTVLYYIPCATDCLPGSKNPACRHETLNCTSISHASVKYGENIRNAMSQTQPDVLMLIDAHFRELERSSPERSREAWDLALTEMLKDAQASGVKTTVWFTSGPFDRPGEYSLATAKLRIEMHEQSFYSIAAKHACPPGQTGMHWMMFEWHRLVCPEYKDLEEEEECSQRQHGFETILEDKLHPKGPPGNWLVANTMRAILEEVARDDMGNSKAEYETTLFPQCMVETYPPDDNPPILNLIHKRTICL